MELLKVLWIFWLQFIPSRHQTHLVSIVTLSNRWKASLISEMKSCEIHRLARLSWIDSISSSRLLTVNFCSSSVSLLSRQTNFLREPFQLKNSNSFNFYNAAFDINKWKLFQKFVLQNYQGDERLPYTAEIIQLRARNLIFKFKLNHYSAKISRRILIKQSKLGRINFLQNKTNPSIHNFKNLFINV